MAMASCPAGLPVFEMPPVAPIAHATIPRQPGPGCRQSRMWKPVALRVLPTYWSSLIRYFSAMCFLSTYLSTHMGPKGVSTNFLPGGAGALGPGKDGIAIGATAGPLGAVVVVVAPAFDDAVVVPALEG